MRKATKIRIERLETRCRLLQNALQALTDHVMADGDVVAQKDSDRIMKPLRDFDVQTDSEDLWGKNK